MKDVKVPRRWECDSCGFENKPHHNRILPEQHLKCEQCGKPEPHAELELVKHRAAGQEVRLA